jgi:methanethiol S-methyltransferase
MPQVGGPPVVSRRYEASARILRRRREHLLVAEERRQLRAEAAHGGLEAAVEHVPDGSQPMGKLFFYAAVSYALFLVSMLWMVAFLGNFIAPKTIDIGAGKPASLPLALIVDGALLALFALQHSVMARPCFKRAWTRIVPAAVERATYVLASSLALLALLAFWEPIPRVVWRVESSAERAAIWGLFGLGWLIALTSTFLIDHFHLFGLRQALRPLKGRAEHEPPFKKGLFYRLVRHPLMVGFSRRLLGSADDEPRASRVHAREHALHSRRRSPGGARSPCVAGRGLRRVPEGRPDALARPPTYEVTARRSGRSLQAHCGVEHRAHLGLALEFGPVFRCNRRGNRVTPLTARTTCCR